MFGLKKSPIRIGKHNSVDPGHQVSSQSNPFDSDDELDNKQTLKPSKRTSSEPKLTSPKFSTNPLDDDDIKENTAVSSYSLTSAARNKYRDDFCDSGGLENQSVQELENYAVYKAEDTTKQVHGFLKIAEEIREDATKTLVSLHQQGEQITRTHYTAANIDHNLSRRVELHAKSLSEARNEDKKHIQELERELMNCSQEIDYLQDQLNARNEEVYSLSEHVHNLELKLVDMENLQDKAGQLEEELRRSDSECLLLMEELQSKEERLRNSALYIKKLEESISSSALESQCEIESLKIDMIALEQTCVEAKKVQKENVQEKTRMNSLIKELEVRIQDSQEIIECLDNGNKELNEKLDSYETNARVFCQKIEEWMEKEDRTQLDIQSLVSELERNLTVSKETCFCGKVFGALLSKAALVLPPDANMQEKIKSMSLQICEYELIVKQLKEELRAEKFKAKEEAEDLAQEMAELRYQMTSLLEEECKRRACIEQASLQRIAELETQIEKGQNKCVASGRHLPI